MTKRDLEAGARFDRPKHRHCAHWAGQASTTPSTTRCSSLVPRNAGHCSYGPRTRRPTGHTPDAHGAIAERLRDDPGAFGCPASRAAENLSRLPVRLCQLAGGEGDLALGEQGERIVGMDVRARAQQAIDTGPVRRPVKDNSAARGEPSAPCLLWGPTLRRP